MPRYRTRTGVPLGFAQPGTKRERELLARGAVLDSDGSTGTPADPGNGALLAKTVNQVLNDVADFGRDALHQVLVDEQAGRARTTLIEGLQTLIDTHDHEQRIRQEAGIE